MKPATVLLWAVVSAARAADPAVPLYEPAAVPGVTATPTDDGWFPVSSMIFNSHYFYAAGEGVTQFDSFPAEETGGWTTIGLVTGNVLHPASPVLDSNAGFTLTVALALDEENHDPAVDIDGDGIADEAGFTIMILDQHAVGIALNFWADRIWASSNQYVSDTDPLAQAEGVGQEPSAMARLRTYALTIKQGAYQLRIDGAAVLEGPTRSYDFFGLMINPFNKPNIITMGDASFRAGARARIGAITVRTCHAPEGPPKLRVTREPGGVRLAWDTVPGLAYTLQGGADLEAWNDLAAFVADSFSASHLEPFRDAIPSRYYRVVRIDP